MDDLVEITSGDLTAHINPLGAELWSLTDRKGREYMTNADPAFWTGHAPILFPIVGALNEGRYRLGDKTYAMPKHGFARNCQFESTAAAGNSAATFRLNDSPDTRRSYPFGFALQVTFLLEGSTLSMIAMVSNRGTEPMPFSLGFHPAFAWPLPGGAPKQAHHVIFAEPEPQPIRRIDRITGLLLPEPETTPVIGRMLALDAALFEADAMIWDDLRSRSLRFGADGADNLEIAFPDMAMLGIWQKPGAAYLCIEPWHGIADPDGYTGDFRNKPGVSMLAGGDTRTFRLDVTVRPA